MSLEIRAAKAVPFRVYTSGGRAYECETAGRSGNLLRCGYLVSLGLAPSLVIFNSWDWYPSENKE